MGVLNNINVLKATKDKPGAGMPILPNVKRVPAGPYNALIAAKATKYGVPVDLSLRQAEQESARFHPDVVAGRKKSPAGASGLYQFMEATAKNVAPKLGLNWLDVLTKPEPAAEAGNWYMGYLYKKFGNWKHAAWAYNWGEGNVAKLLRGERKALPEETRLYGLVVVDGYTLENAKKLPKSTV